MKTWEFLLAVVLFTVSSFYVGVGASYRIETTNQYDAFIDETIDWIGRNSSYDTTSINRRPLVVLADRETINYLWRAHYGQSAEAVNAFFDEQIIKVDGQPDVSLYKIYFPREYDLRNLLHAKTGVHEIVHFVQYVLGYNRRVSCSGKLEPDAYRLAVRWLRQHGFKDEKYISDYLAKGKEKGKC